MSIARRLNAELQQLTRFADPFDDAFNQSGRQFTDNFNQSGRQFSQLPSLDVTETKNAFVVQADVPGFRREEIEISLEGQVLALQGRRERREDRKDETAHVRERIQNNFYRSLTLPGNYAPENVKANLRDGTLEINIPKNTAANRKITIA